MIKNYGIHQLFPDFILADKNGYALAKAINRALEIMCEVVADGVDTAVNIEKMPVWRLDELAWEYNSLYDYNADAEAKRQWIRDAISLSSLYGTAQAIRYYLTGYFENAQVEELTKADGSPFHFKVSVAGRITQENIEWASDAISVSQNVRSVFDGLNFVTAQDAQKLYAGCAIHKEVQTTLHSDDYAYDQAVLYTDEDDVMLTDEYGMVLLAEVNT